MAGRNACGLSSGLNERDWKERPAPVEALLHWAAAPIQLQVQTKDPLLEPGMGKQGNILLPAPKGLERGQTVTWTRPWEHALDDSCCPLGSWGGGELANSVLGDWSWPPILKVTYLGPADHEMLVCGTFVISLWPTMCSPLLQVDTEPPVEVQKVWCSCLARRPLPATVSLADQKRACVSLKGCDLPLLVSVTALPFCL